MSTWARVGSWSLAIGSLLVTLHTFFVPSPRFLICTYGGVIVSFTQDGQDGLKDKVLA